MMNRQGAIEKAAKLNGERKGGSITVYTACPSSNPAIWVVLKYDGQNQIPVEIIQDL